MSLTRGRLPYQTTILNFRHLPKCNDLATCPRTEINALPGKRDPEMHQTKKGNNLHVRIKAHIGVDAESGQVTALFALSNLWTVRRRWMSATG